MNPNINFTLGIADDEPLICYALEKLIEVIPGYIISIKATNGEDLLNEIQHNTVPDIILLDIGMPKMDGYETQAVIRENWPSIRTVAISQFSCSFAIKQMIKLGVRGFLQKSQINIFLLQKVLNDVATSGYYYNEIAPVNLFRKIEFGEIIPPNITKKEKRFLRLIGSGFSYKEIATEMNINISTVPSYLKTLKAKFELSSSEDIGIFIKRAELL